MIIGAIIIPMFTMLPAPATLNERSGCAERLETPPALARMAGDACQSHFEALTLYPGQFPLLSSYLVGPVTGGYSSPRPGSSGTFTAWTNPPPRPVAMTTLGQRKRCDD